MLDDKLSQAQPTNPVADHYLNDATMTVVVIDSLSAKQYIKIAQSIKECKILEK